MLNQESIKSLRKGADRYVISLEKERKGIKGYELTASTGSRKGEKVPSGHIDLIPRMQV